MVVEARILDEFKNVNIFKESLVKARVGWQNLTTKEYLGYGAFGLVGGINLKVGRVDWKSIPYVSEWRYEQDRYIQLKRNDVLISKDGTIGKVALVDELPLPATLNSGVFVVRPPKDLCDSKFLFYILTSTIFEDFISKLSAGSTISHLYQKDLGQFSLEIPADLAEQRAIAEALSDIDDLIFNLCNFINKNKVLRIGLRDTLIPKENGSQNHRRIKFSDYLDFSNGYSFKSTTYKTRGHYLIRISNVQRGSLLRNDEIHVNLEDANLLNFELRSGDIVMSLTGNVGRTALVTERVLPAALNQRVGKISLKEVVKEKLDKHFLYQLFQSETFLSIIIEMGEGAAQHNISLKDVGEIEWDVPKDIDEQKRISKLLTDIDEEIEKLQGELQKYEWLKQGMIHDLLTGKVRLV